MPPRLRTIKPALEAGVAADALGALDDAATLFFGLGAGPGWLGEVSFVFHRDEDTSLVALTLKATQSCIERFVRTDSDADQGTVRFDRDWLPLPEW